jgi:hypothetical protein
MRIEGLIIGIAVAMTLGCLTAPIGYAQEVNPTGSQPELMEAVAGLLHARYGEDEYRLARLPDGTLELQEIGQRQFRMVVRRLSGRKCAFQSIQRGHGINVEELDIGKFTGQQQWAQGCGPKGTLFEYSCRYGVTFRSRHGFCQYFFANSDVDLDNVPFPPDNCRNDLTYASWNKAILQRYVERFSYVFQECSKAQGTVP